MHILFHKYEDEIKLEIKINLGGTNRNLPQKIILISRSVPSNIPNKLSFSKFKIRYPSSLKKPFYCE